MAGITALFYILRAAIDAVGRIRRQILERRLRRKWLDEQRQKSRKLLEKLRLSRRRRNFDADDSKQLRQDDGFRRD